MKDTNICYSLQKLVDLFSETEAGVIDKADFRRIFEGFIREYICLRDYPSALSNESINIL